MICNKLTDDEIRERPFWMLKTKNETFYQKDEDENGQRINSWKELKKHAEENHINFTGMWLQFRDHKEEIAVNKDGYFLVYALLVDIGSATHNHYFTCGYLENGQVHCTRWLMPEVMSMQSDVRKLEDCEEVLIYAKNDLEIHRQED